MGQSSGPDRLATGAVGPKDIAKALDMKDTGMSRRGVGHVAANGTTIRNYGEKKIVGYTDDGGGVSLSMPCADVKKVLGSVHKMNMGGNVVVLDVEKTTCNTRIQARKRGIKYEGGQYVMRMRAPPKENEVREESEFFAGQSLRDLGHGR